MLNPADYRTLITGWGAFVTTMRSAGSMWIGFTTSRQVRQVKSLLTDQDLVRDNAVRTVVAAVGTVINSVLAIDETKCEQLLWVGF
jgi:hypothetical protein